MTTQSHSDAAKELQEFLQIIARLRNPNGGCPWDIKQTFESLKPLVLDEAYEVFDAVEVGDGQICEELGDLLSLVALYAQIAEEESKFSFAMVLNGISSKLVRRHPHVFGETKADTAEQVLKNWEAIKEQERTNQQQSGQQKDKQKAKGLLDGLPRSLPALHRAHQIGERCRRVGFDWTSSHQVADKVKEEVNEFLQEVVTANPPGTTKELQPQERARMAEEFGDLLFSLAQYSRHLGINAEEALTAANQKFLKRFQSVESFAEAETGKRSIAGLSAEKMEELWQKAKLSVG
jgi:ATP diphosphatase